MCSYRTFCIWFLKTFFSQHHICPTIELSVSFRFITAFTTVVFYILKQGPVQWYTWHESTPMIWFNRWENVICSNEAKRVADMTPIREHSCFWCLVKVKEWLLAKVGVGVLRRPSKPAGELNVTCECLQYYLR